MATGGLERHHGAAFTILPRLASGAPPAGASSVSLAVGVDQRHGAPASGVISNRRTDNPNSDSDNVPTDRCAHHVDDLLSATKESDHMTGPEHYQQAEHCLSEAAATPDADRARELRERALAHAQLATAAAIAMTGGSMEGGKMKSADTKAWRAVVGADE
jgi:hypothetical protein